jgi:hypothetical protein
MCPDDHACDVTPLFRGVKAAGVALSIVIRALLA